MNKYERSGLRMLALTSFQKIRRRERAKMDAGTVTLNEYWERVERFHEALQRLDAALAECAKPLVDTTPKAASDQALADSQAQVLSILIPALWQTVTGKSNEAA